MIKLATRTMIVSKQDMGCKPNYTALRGICIIEDKHIYVTELYYGGRILCLDWNGKGRYVEELSIKLSEKERPSIIAHYGNIIVYSYFLGEDNCHIRFVYMPELSASAYIGFPYY